MEKKIKIGDTVVLYSTDPRHSTEVTEVTGIGKKYITVRTTKDHNRYDVGDYSCVDWSCWKLFPGTVKGYKKYKEHEEEAKALRKKLIDRINKAGYYELKVIHNFLYPAQ